MRSPATHDVKISVHKFQKQATTRTSDVLHTPQGTCGVRTDVLEVLRRVGALRAELSVSAISAATVFATHLKSGKRAKNARARSALLLAVVLQ